MPEVVYLRVNPGDIDLGSDSQLIMGLPNEAKFGMTEKQIFNSLKLLKEHGVKKFGIHTMLVTNEQNYRYIMKIIKIMFELALNVSKELKIECDGINLGGGFGVPYHPEDPEFELKQYAKKLLSAFNESGLKQLSDKQKKPIKLYTENGRWVTAECGFLLTKVINKKKTYRTYVGVDATMSNLMRPGMYGAYHFIKVLSGRNNFSTKIREVVDIVGALCENNDKFAVQRAIPVTEENDIMVIHTVGAHCSCMGFQYNGRLRCAEILLKQNGSKQLIKRAENIDDYFSTLIY
jgi:diaminopimelate decarboxylase